MMTAAKHTNVSAACCNMQVLTQTQYQLHVPNDGVLGGVAVSVTDIIELCPHQIAAQLLADDSEMGE